MRIFAKTTSGLAILVLLLTGAMANAQTANKKSANLPASPTASDSTANQKKTKSTGSMQSAQSNPLYEDKREGTNPFYERDSAARKNGDANSAQSTGAAVQQNAQAHKAPSTTATASHEVVEYKDPEDMTTRYRPGNNKTTKTVTPVGPPSSPNVVEYKDGEDGTTHTRPK